MVNPTVYPEWILFGDSITQQSFSAGGFGQYMADCYQRRVDIINRGYGGYNSDWALRLLPNILPPKGSKKPFVAMNIWLGANDACLPQRTQSISIEDFKSNIGAMVDMLQDPKSTHYSPDTIITILSCPPICVAQREEHVRAEWGPDIVLDRTFERTKSFAKAAGEVAALKKVGFVDVFDAIMHAAGPNPETGLRKFFNDGLHLTSQGYQVVAKAVQAYLEQHQPKLLPDAFPKVFPPWDEIDPKNPGASFPPQ